MDNDGISDLIILGLVFIGTISFAVTSFGGDILFQLGISLCSLSGTLCRGSLLTTLAMITLMAFIKLPIQLCLLRKYINYDLAIRLSIPMVIGSVLGLHILTVSNNDLLLKRIFGYIITIISLYHLVNDSIKDSRSNIVQNYNNEEVHNNISSSSSDEVNPHLYISYTMKNDQDNDINDIDNKFKINSRSKELTIYVAGLLAGLLAGVYGTGGPPLMILATHIKIDKDEWRGTCCATYFIQNLVAATYISTYDEYRIKSRKQYMMTVLLICTVLIALYYGNIIADTINTNLWKKLILFLLMIGSGIMICSGYSVYIQFITILVLMSLYGVVYCITLKYLGVEIISTIRNQYYNVPIEESIPHRESSDLNHITMNT